MQLQFEIEDIKREDVAEAMATALMTTWVHENDPETGPSTYLKTTPLAEQLGKMVRARVDQLAEQQVREYFDDTIKARIGAAVDEVLATGWTRTDNYGNAVGERIDLKGRISEIILEKKQASYSKPALTLADRLVVDTVETVMRSEFSKELEAARATLRTQLDAVVAGKFAETIKSALGVR